MLTRILVCCLVIGVVVAQAKGPAIREVSIIVSKEGYYPKNLTVFKGEKVKFYVTAVDEGPDCLIVQGHKVFMAATKGKISEAETVFANSGDFAFYCPSSKHDGKITVLEKQKSSPDRGVAGSAEPSVWTPKEY